MRARVCAYCVSSSALFLLASRARTRLVQAETATSTAPAVQRGSGKWSGIGSDGDSHIYGWCELSRGLPFFLSFLFFCFIVFRFVRVGNFLFPSPFPLLRSRTPLLFAVARGRDDIATVLLRHAADVNIAHSGGYTALMYVSPCRLGLIVVWVNLLLLLLSSLVLFVVWQTPLLLCLAPLVIVRSL